MRALEFIDIWKASCQSPIEASMLEAIVKIADSEESWSVEFKHHWHTHETFKKFPAKQQYEIWFHSVLFIWPQAQINNYRADFIVGALAYDVQKDESGQYIEYLSRKPLIVIECDGHDFHERTKEQAQHDKSRDRYFQSLGFRVLRFTGSEIYRDSTRCAKEVFDLILSLPCEP